MKRMPNWWICKDHQEFLKKNPGETELPWQDLGCSLFLARLGYHFVARTLGVYRDDLHTYVVTTLAEEGDLFTWSQGEQAQGLPPGPQRERFVKTIARQMFIATAWLHNLCIVHRDLSMENVLVSRSDRGELQLQLIDFALASTERFQRHSAGKARYQAPEMHSDFEYDGFRCDTFSLGVTLYGVLLDGQPWASTDPGACAAFKYCCDCGFRALLQRRKMRTSNVRISECISQSVAEILCGLLAFEPCSRLTLGENVFLNDQDATPVWDSCWWQPNSEDIWLA